MKSCIYSMEKSGMRNTTLKDIAKKLDLSEATVSLAINNKAIVSKKTRERVLACAREMNYKPNPLARGLATSKSMTIGFICPDPENPFIGKMLKLISRYCNEQGYSMMVAISEGNAEQEGRILQNFIDQRMDGVIIFAVDEVDNPSEAFQNAKDQNIPIVFCDTFYARCEMDCIATDYTKGMYLLTKHLLENDHRDFWFLTIQDPEMPASKLRINGCVQAFKEWHLEMGNEWIFRCEKATGEAAYQMTKKLLQEKEKPDAILTLNDYMAYGARMAIRELGYKIPEDVSLAGYDDAFQGVLYENPLTTVRQDADLIAKECVQLLMERIDPEHHRLETAIIRNTEPQLIIRNTTRNCRKI